MREISVSADSSSMPYQIMGHACLASDHTNRRNNLGQYILWFQRYTQTHGFLTQAPGTLDMDEEDYATDAREAMDEVESSSKKVQDAGVQGPSRDSTVDVPSAKTSKNMGGGSATVSEQR